MFFNRRVKANDEPSFGELHPEQPTNVRSMEVATLSRRNTAPNSGIGYHPDLISRFETCHVSLQKLFMAMKTHAMKDEFTDALKSLQSFRKLLVAHLLEENVKLYSYLSHCLQNDPDNRDLMRSMKGEMGKIGTAVMHFLEGYAKSGITPFNKQQFLKELDEIGAVLADRIEREETTLYSMYLPPDAFD